MNRICVFTGTRAEYGLLRPLILEMMQDPDIEFQLIVSGTHLSTEHGLTCREIEAEGIPISEKVEMVLSSDTPTAVLKSFSVGVDGYGEALKRLTPDAVLVLGDRYEAMAMAVAAMISRMPVIHLYGGEATFGLIDEAIRHSITKMSHLHFTSTETYRQRVIQLGEHPSRVFNVGAIGLDNLTQLKLLSKEDLEKALDFTFKPRNLLVTFHPVTLENNTSEDQIMMLLETLGELQDTGLIFTKSNSDTDGRIINQKIDEFVSRHPHHSKVFTSMGSLLYLSAMSHVDAVVGNSSSGIIEAPTLRTGTINIGDRQAGRVQAESIINCEPTTQAIREALQELYSEHYINKVRDVNNPYYQGENCAKRIINIIKGADFKHMLKKQFYNIRIREEYE